MGFNKRYYQEGPNFTKYPDKNKKYSVSAGEQKLEKAKPGLTEKQMKRQTILDKIKKGKAKYSYTSDGKMLS
jgi:tRNA pseudouridine-54 N-methylase